MRFTLENKMGWGWCGGKAWGAEKVTLEESTGYISRGTCILFCPVQKVVHRQIYRKTGIHIKQ